MTAANWKTLVLISVNLVGLEVKMNVGNVMGNVSMYTKNARVTSKISISRFGPKDMLFNFALENSRLIAEGGSNGCLVRIQDITACVECSDKNKQNALPFHKCEVFIYATEMRVDSAYNQASPILACRLSSLNVKLNDSWVPSVSASGLTSTHQSATRPTLVTSSSNGDAAATAAEKLPESLLELNMAWDQLHLMITRSTTPDLIMLYYKLVDFIDKQFAESKDYIKECELDLFYEAKVKQQFVQSHATESLLAATGRHRHPHHRFNVNGGSIQLKGNNFTLITFHGNNFKAKKWAVFSLNEPSMDFASQQSGTTASGDGDGDGDGDGEPVLIQQNLGFYLGRNERKKDMASIYMVYRDSTNVFTRFQTINEWFEYAHSNIDAVGLRDFPRFSFDEHPLFTAASQAAAAKKANKINEQTKWEEIFHLPSLQILCDATQENSSCSVLVFPLLLLFFILLVFV